MERYFTITNSPTNFKSLGTYYPRGSLVCKHDWEKEIQNMVDCNILLRIHAY